MTKIKVKETINLELRKGDEFEIIGASAEDYIKRLANFPHYVQIGDDVGEVEAIDQAAGDVESADEIDFSKLKKAELLALAKEREIDVPSDATKDEIIELLKAGE